MKLLAAAIALSSVLTATSAVAQQKKPFNPENSDGTGYSCSDANRACAAGCRSNAGADGVDNCVKITCGSRLQSCLATGSYQWRLYPSTTNLAKR
jgi:hypothetical protein